LKREGGKYLVSIARWCVEICEHYILYHISEKTHFFLGEGPANEIDFDKRHFGNCISLGIFEMKEDEGGRGCSGIFVLYFSGPH
jgi:hypothetical protein